MYTNFIGIDIGKCEVVVGLQGSKQTQTYPNTKVGLKQFMKDHRPYLAQSLVVLETTGGYEKLFLHCLVEKNIAVHRANTRQTHAFAKSLGIKGKTDSIDAVWLARYGYERWDRLKPYQKPEPLMEILQALAQRRLDLKKMLVQEKNRLQAPDTQSSVKDSCQIIIECLEEQLKAIMSEMNTLVATQPDLASKRTLLETIPGIGEKISLELVVLLPELGQINRREIASLVGVAPHPKESGQRVGYRHTHGGRREVRATLFMAALTVARSKSYLGEKFRSMTAAGKKKMVALVAIMRRILVIANAKVKNYLEEQPTTGSSIIS